MPEELDNFTRGYLASALWAENDNSDDRGGDPLDSNYSISDFAPSAIERAVKDCRDFQQKNAALLALAYERYVRVDADPVEAYGGMTSG